MSHGRRQDPLSKAMFYPGVLAVVFLVLSGVTYLAGMNQITRVAVLAGSGLAGATVTGMVMSRFLFDKNLL
ncbi:MAG: hypothetical protein SXQ77_04600 [Halobacteria archaeon]|nr:hypothetical protein [Halobacteria archaeon]